MTNAIDIQMIEVVRNNTIVLQIKQNGVWHEIDKEDFIGKERQENGSCDQ